MGLLKELYEKPKVVIENELYVPQELYKRYIVSKLEDEKLDCANQDEKDGIDLAISCIWNS